MKRQPPGLPRSVRTPEKVDTVRRAVLASPKRSARHQALALGMSRRSLHCILHDELKFHPYKIMIVQQLSKGDFAQCRDFCENVLAIFTEDANAVVMMSDEAYFHLNGFVNKQNCRFRAAQNPQELHQRPLHSSKVTVWCGVSKVGIVGPYFFEEGETAVSVTSARYIDMLNNFLCPELQRRGVNMREMWFQQDGATAHMARVLMEVVPGMFPQHVISRFSDVSWPPRSPDLSICDFLFFFLFFSFFGGGYLKSRVYTNRPRTIEELKLSICQEIAALPQEMLEHAMQDFEERLRMCVRQEGRHLTDIIFRM